MPAPVDTERLVCELADKIWAEKFAARYAAETAREAQRRAEAFLDVPVPVAGFILRPLTPHDVLLLDGAESPYVAGNPEDAKRSDLALATWLLSDENRPGVLNALRKRRHIERCARRWASDGAFIRAHDSFISWLDDAFVDGTSPKSESDAGRRPLGTHFLAPLLISLSSEIGALDPATGRPFIHSPVARLWQYLKVIRARTSRVTDFSPSDRLKSEMLDELNARLPAYIAERTAAASDLSPASS